MCASNCVGTIGKLPGVHGGHWTPVSSCGNLLLQLLPLSAVTSVDRELATMFNKWLLNAVAREVRSVYLGSITVAYVNGNLHCSV